MKIEVRCVMHLYQFPMKNVIIMYCKHTLIKDENCKKKTNYDDSAALSIAKSHAKDNSYFPLVHVQSK